MDTWVSLLLYGTGPVVLATLIFWISFSSAFELGIRHLGTGPVFGFLSRSLLSKIGLLVLLLIAIFAANLTVDNWTVVRYFGGLRVPQVKTEFVDPIFGKSLHFYFLGCRFTIWCCMSSLWRLSWRC